MKPIRLLAAMATAVLATTACNGGEPAASDPSEQTTSLVGSARPTATSRPSPQPTKKLAKPDA
jgi:hypothetical protein